MKNNIIDRIKELSLSLEKWQKDILKEIWIECLKYKGTEFILAPFSAIIFIDWNYKPTNKDLKKILEIINEIEDEDLPTTEDVKGILK